MLQRVDWHKIFWPDTPLLEIIARGTITYLGILLMMRIVMKRQSAGIGVTDILVVVLLSDAAQNSMAGSYTSITDGLLLISVILFWSFFLDFLSYHVAVIERLLNPSPLLLIRNGKMLTRNMRRELVTKEELMVELRKDGVDDISLVKRAYMERDGKISMVLREKAK